MQTNTNVKRDLFFINTINSNTKTVVLLNELLIKKQHSLKSV